MTKNQLQYWEGQERIRSNKENEAVARENLAIAKENLEIGRLNAASNRISSLANQENARVGALNAATNIKVLEETQRSNLTREAETNRSNLARENLEQQLRDIQNMGAITENSKLKILAQQAAIAAATLQETRRANIANEALKQQVNDETTRSNLAREQELNRHQLATESNEALKTLYSRMNKLTDKDIAEMNLTQTQLRDLNNFKVDLYQLLLDSGELNVKQQQVWTGLLNTGKTDLSDIATANKTIQNTRR